MNDTERLRRDQFRAGANEAHRKVGADPEQDLWDCTLADGLESEPSS